MEVDSAALLTPLGKHATVSLEESGGMSVEYLSDTATQDGSETAEHGAAFRFLETEASETSSECTLSPEELSEAGEMDTEALDGARYGGAVVHVDGNELWKTGMENGSTLVGGYSSSGGFSALPMEVQDHILSMLSMEDKLRSRRVCKLWRHLLSRKHLWHEFRPLGWYATRLGDAHMEVMCDLASSHMRRIVLQDCHVISDRVFVDFLLQCTALEELDLTGCRWVKNHLLSSGLVNSHTSLRYLDLSFTSVTGECCLFGHCTNCNRYPNSPTLPRLEQLALIGCRRLTDVGCHVLGLNAPNLTYLNIAKNHHLTGSGIASIARGCRKLQVFNMSGCPRICPQALISSDVLEGFPELRELDVEGCFLLNVSHALGYLLYHCSKLEKLNVCSDNINDTSLCYMVDYGAASNLQELQMSFCSFSDYGLACLARRCSSLRKLELDNCTEVTDVGLQVIVAANRNLERISLAGLPRVTDYALCAVAEFCRDLRSLNLSKVKHITDAGLTTVAHACPELSHLDITRCRNITDLSFVILSASCRKLEFVYMARCSGITIDAVRALSTLDNLKHYDAHYCANVPEALQQVASVSHQPLVERIKTLLEEYDLEQQRLRQVDSSSSVHQHISLRALCGLHHAFVQPTQPVAQELAANSEIMELQDMATEQRSQDHGSTEQAHVRNHHLHHTHIHHHHRHRNVHSRAHTHRRGQRVRDAAASGTSTTMSTTSTTSSTSRQTGRTSHARARMVGRPERGHAHTEEEVQEHDEHDELNQQQHPSADGRACERGMTRKRSVDDVYQDAEAEASERQPQQHAGSNHTAHDEESSTVPMEAAKRARAT